MPDRLSSNVTENKIHKNKVFFFFFFKIYGNISCTVVRKTVKNKHMPQPKRANSVGRYLV